MQSSAFRQIYAKAEEIAEMMPLSPRFQRLGLQLHVQLSVKDGQVMDLDKAARRPPASTQQEVDPLPWQNVACAQGSKWTGAKSAFALRKASLRVEPTPACSIAVRPATP